MERGCSSRNCCRCYCGKLSLVCILLCLATSSSQQSTDLTAEDCMMDWDCLWTKQYGGVATKGQCVYRLGNVIDSTRTVLNVIAPPGPATLLVTCDRKSTAPTTTFQCLRLLSGNAQLMSLRLENCVNLEIRNGALDPFEYLEKLSTQWGSIKEIENRAFYFSERLVTIEFSQDFSPNGMTEYPTALTGPSVNASADRLSNISSNAFLPNLRELLFENFIFQTGIPTGAFLNLKGLSTISFRHCTFENSDFGKLTVLTDLISLTVSDTLQVHTVPKILLLSLRNLTSLELSSTLISRVEKDDLTPLTELVYLTIHSNLEFIHPSAFEKLNNLISLDIHGNSFLGLRDKVPSFLGIPNLENLFLHQCYFSELSEFDFENVTRLKNLDLHSNKLQTVPIIFANFDVLPVKLIELEDVDLSDNMITSILSYTFSNMPKLKVINLADNHITEIKENTFYNLPAIKCIRLRGNLIHAIHLRSFAEIHSLELLDLSGNHLEHFPFLMGVNSDDFAINGLPSRPFQTKLEGNPLKCDCIMFHDLFVKSATSGQWMLPYYATSIWPGNWNLANQVFDREKIECSTTAVGPQKIDAMMTEEALSEFYDIERSTGDCSSLCDCYYQCYSSLLFALCIGVNLTEVPRNLTANVTSLSLRDNSISSLSRDSFSHLPQLQYIDLSGNNISCIEGGTFYELSDLVFVFLNMNNLRQIDRGMFNISSKLFVYLNLSSNRISLIEDQSFDEINTITHLELADNDLRAVPFGILDNLRNLSYLTVAGNPFNCSCELLYLTNWYKDVVFGNKDRLYTDVNDVNCSANFSNETELLGWIELQEAECNAPPTHEPVTKVSVTRIIFSTEEGGMLTLISSISVSIIVTATFCWLVYRYRQEILVLVYVKTGLRPFKTIANGADKLYDAFISFSSLDLDFVVREVLPRLESGEMKRKLCIHHRDFTVGECIATNIVNAIENSNKIVILCSKNYLESEWCSYEFKKSHQQALKDRSRRIVLIMMEPVDDRLMDKEIKAYTSTNTYLDRKDALFWSKLAYSIPACKRLKGEANRGHATSEGDLNMNESII